MEDDVQIDGTELHTALKTLLPLTKGTRLASMPACTLIRLMRRNNVLVLSANNLICQVSLSVHARGAPFCQNWCVDAVALTRVAAAARGRILALHMVTTPFEGLTAVTLPQTDCTLLSVCMPAMDDSRFAVLRTTEYTPWARVELYDFIGALSRVSMAATSNPANDVRRSVYLEVRGRTLRFATTDGTRAMHDEIPLRDVEDRSVDFALMTSYSIVHLLRALQLGSPRGGLDLLMNNDRTVMLVVNDVVEVAVLLRRDAQIRTTGLPPATTPLFHVSSFTLKEALQTLVPTTRVAQLTLRGRAEELVIEDAYSKVATTIRFAEPAREFSFGVTMGQIRDLVKIAAGGMIHLDATRAGALVFSLSAVPTFRYIVLPIWQQIGG